MINKQDSVGCTASWFAAAHDRLDILKLLVKHGADINISDKFNQTPLYLACVNNKHKCVDYLVNECKEIKCDVNIQATNTGTSALGAACIVGNLECVKILCKCKDVKILELRTPDTDVSIIEQAILGSIGDVKVVQHLYQTLIDRNKITDFNGIIKHKIVSIESINDLLQGLESVHLKLGAMYKFLSQLLEEAIKPQNFQTFLVLIDYQSNSIKKQRTDIDYAKMNKNFQIAQTFVNYLSKNGNSKAISFWNKAINNLIINKEAVTDTLLFIANIIDQKQLIATLTKCVSDCIDNTEKQKNETNYAYYKQCLLHSSVWALKSKDYIDLDNDSDKKSDDNFDKKKTDGMLYMLFDHVKNSVIDPLLRKQQLLIEKCIKNEMNSEMSDWTELCQYKDYNIGRYGVIRQDCTINVENNKNIMAIEKKSQYMLHMKLFSFVSKLSAKNETAEEGLRSKACEYEMKDIANDLKENWDGCDEYNFEGYLTQLLLIANNVNYEFQNDCKRFFSNKDNALVSCTFKPGTVKTKERSVKKTITDYLYVHVVIFTLPFRALLSL